jgi:hypothetical protein
MFGGRLLHLQPEDAPVAGPYEHGNELSDSIKRREFRD